MREAGVPAGVVNFIPADGPVFGDTITASPHLAGINFTGSVPWVCFSSAFHKLHLMLMFCSFSSFYRTFARLWRQVGENVSKYVNFPRLIGECGGKNYHFVHPSADVDTVATGTIRSAFEYCGQKCSACSRAYIPESLWPAVRIHVASYHIKYFMNFTAEFLVSDQTKTIATTWWPESRRCYWFLNICGRCYRWQSIRPHKIVHRSCTKQLKLGNHWRWPIRWQQRLLYSTNHRSNQRSTW